MNVLTVTPNPIEVAQEEVKRAKKLLNSQLITYRMNATNIFVIDDMDEWNDAMELFEANHIKLK
jgi:hypothetical protein